MPFALKFATAEQAVSNEQRFVEINRRLDSKLLQLSCNGGTHSFDWGELIFLAITLLANRTKTWKCDASQHFQRGSNNLRHVLNATSPFTDFTDTSTQILQAPSPTTTDAVAKCLVWDSRSNTS